MSQSNFRAPPARSWRDIPQQVKPRAMSDGGRRRLVFSVLKTVGAIALITAVSWLGLSAAMLLRNGPDSAVRQGGATPVKDIVLITDGALGHDWLVRTLALPRNATLMSLDLFQLRERLLACGQVRSASLTRNFPSTLSVSLTERMAVARLMARAGEGPARQLLVARDGVVFEGVGYDETATDALPWLDGVKLSRQGGTLQPIAGMESVADLLSKARLEADHLYRTWQVVSLARLGSDGEIEVRTVDGLRVVFGTLENFFPQLARLDLLLDTAQVQSAAPPREVNLAIGARVPVVFEGLTAAAADKPSTPPHLRNLRPNAKL